VRQTRSEQSPVNRADTALSGAPADSRHSLPFLLELLATSPEAIFAFDRAGICRFASHAGTSLLGLEAGECSGRSWLDFGFAPGSREAFEASCRDVIETGWVAEGRGTREAPGGPCDVEYTLSPWRDDQGAVTGLVCVLRNTARPADTASELARVVRQVTAINEEWRSTLDSLPVLVVLVDGEGKVVRLNRTAEAWGLTQVTQAPGKRLHDLLHPGCAPDACWSEPAFREAPRAIQEGHGLELDVEDPILGRSLRAWFHRLAPLSDGPSAASMVVVLEDITPAVAATLEPDRMEVQLRQAQKMESIGQLAAGIAHEINTPIQFVSDNLVFLHDSFGAFRSLLTTLRETLAAAKRGELTPEKAAETEEGLSGLELDFYVAEVPQAIRQARDGAERVASIVAAMKAFSHPGPAVRKPVDLRSAIDNTVTVARNRWKYHARLEVEHDPQLPAVSCVAGEFNQVMLNLIVNAADAVAEKKRGGGDGDGLGLIRITTRADGAWAEIRVQDDGTGIPDSVRGRIFEPFFTTKEVGQGSGQGLALCHAIIVKKHGGTLDFETEAGRGTTFIVRLPIDPDESAGPEAPPAR